MSAAVAAIDEVGVLTYHSKGIATARPSSIAIGRGDAFFVPAHGHDPRARHARGSEDTIPQVVGIGLPGDILQDDRREQDSVCRIGGLQSRCAIADKLVANESGHVRECAAVELPSRQFIEAAGMGQQVTQRERRKALRRHLDPSQVSVDVGVETDTAVIDEL